MAEQCTSTINTSTIHDANTEMLTVGCFFKNPELFLDYGDLIKSKYDFYHETSKFLYNSAYSIFHYQSQDMPEVKVNYYMSQDDERQERYKKLGGYHFIERVMALSDIDDFDVYYNNLKKYSLLRELERKGFPSQKIFDKNLFDKLTPEQILDSMEYTIHTIGTVIGGVEESVILGKDIENVYEQWKIAPDIGTEIPFPIINQAIRGFRKKKLILFGMHSGCGKSRTTSKVICDIGIKQKKPILLCVNEQDKTEWDAMILSSVINNPEFGFNGKINETKIVTGTCNAEEDKLCKRASKWIAENTQIYFLYQDKFQPHQLERQIKRHKIKGCEFFVYDTLKAPDFDWQSFVKTANMLKEISNSLDMGCWATFQLTDDSLFNELLTSQAIANGKHIKHVADILMMARPIFRDEYNKYEVINPLDDFYSGDAHRLNKEEDYYILFLDKNRGGKDKHKIALRVDKGRNYWQEAGYLVESEDTKEQKRISKELSMLKKMKQAKEIREELTNAD